ncbi:MAG TPA: universal stress protein [Crinalium sp.]
MLPLTALELHLPILLATDGCSHIEDLQDWLYPVIRLLPPQDGDRSPFSIFKFKSHCAVEPEAAQGAASPTNVQVDHPARRPAIAVLNQAQAMDAGCLAIAFRDPSGTSELSNIAVAIARQAIRPVLIMRQRDNGDHAPSWKHVLLVVNAAEGTRQAIAITQQLIPAGIEAITILYIQPPLNTHYLFGPFATPTPSWQLNQSLHQAQREQAEAIVHQAQAAFQASPVTLHTLIQTGEPGPAICQVAQQQQVDLVVMSNSPIPRFIPADSSPAFQPSPVMPTSDYLVRHAPCPVMLCHTAQPMLFGKAFHLPKAKLRIPRLPGVKPRVKSPSL